MTIRVLFTVKKRFEDGRPYPESNLEFLELDTLVPVTLDGAKEISFGRWSSWSNFIGFHTSGKYYVKNIHPTKEDVMAFDGPPQGLSAMNPVAFFFDSQWEDPFMVLYKLAPMEFFPARGSMSAGGLSRFSYAAVHLTHVQHEISWLYEAAGQPDSRHF
jgi:hypothetical protein